MIWEQVLKLPYGGIIGFHFKRWENYYRVHVQVININSGCVIKVWVLIWIIMNLDHRQSGISNNPLQLFLKLRVVVSVVIIYQNCVIIIETNHRVSMANFVGRIFRDYDYANTEK